MTQKLTSVDNAFFQLESHDTPMHVAGLQIFTLRGQAFFMKGSGRAASVRVRPGSRRLAW